MFINLGTGRRELARARQHGPSTYVTIRWPDTFATGQPGVCSAVAPKSAYPGYCFSDECSLVVSDFTAPAVLSEVSFTSPDTNTPSLLSPASCSATRNLGGILQAPVLRLARRELLIQKVCMLQDGRVSKVIYMIRELLSESQD